MFSFPSTGVCQFVLEPPGGAVASSCVYCSWEASDLRESDTTTAEARGLYCQNKSMKNIMGTFLKALLEVNHYFNRQKVIRYKKKKILSPSCKVLIQAHWHYDKMKFIDVNGTIIRLLLLFTNVSNLMSL